jgi:hypothetical protein
VSNLSHLDSELIQLIRGWLTRETDRELDRLEMEW